MTYYNVLPHPLLDEIAILSYNYKIVPYSQGLEKMEVG